MNVDAVGFVGEHPTIVIYTIVNLPSISLLVYFGAEYSRNLMLDDLKDSGRMDYHKVDVYASCAESTSRGSGGRLCKSDLRVEPCGRNADNSHSVIHLDFAVDVGVAILRITSDVALEVGIDGRVNEQDSSLVGNFLVVKCSFCGLNEVSYVIRTRKSTSSSSARISGIFSKTIGVDFGDDLYALKLAEGGSHSHAKGFVVVHYVDGEGTTSILFDGEGFPCAVGRTRHEASVSAVVAKTINIYLEDFCGLCADEVDSLVCGVEDSGKALPLIDLVEQRKELCCKANAVCNRSSHSSCHL